MASKAQKMSNKEVEKYLAQLSATQLRRLIRSIEQGNAPASDVLSAKEVLAALKQYRKGDFSVRLAEGAGIAGDIAREFNLCVEQQVAVHKELAATAKAIGDQGRLATEAYLEDVPEAWQAPLQSMNHLADKLTQPVYDVIESLTAQFKGDFSYECNVNESKGEIRALLNHVNKLNTRLNQFTTQLQTFVREGLDKEQGIDTNGLTGLWRESLNLLGKRELQQQTNMTLITDALTALQQGKFSEEALLEADGAMPIQCQVINGLQQRIQNLLQQVNVLQSVISQGKFDIELDQDKQPGVWGKANRQCASLLSQLHEHFADIDAVLAAGLAGEFQTRTQKAGKGQIAQAKHNLNDFMQQTGEFCDAINKVHSSCVEQGEFNTPFSQSVVAGQWGQAKQAVQATMTAFSESQASYITQIDALLKGDLQAVTAHAGQDILGLQARLVSLAEQIQLVVATLEESSDLMSKGDTQYSFDANSVAGCWQNLLENHNAMHASVNQQLSSIDQAVDALKSGKFDYQCHNELSGQFLQVHVALEQMLSGSMQLCKDVTRLAQNIAKDKALNDKLGTQKFGGAWEVMTLSINEMVSALQKQLSELTKMTDRVAQGEFVVPAKSTLAGDFVPLRDSLHTLIDQASQFFPQLLALSQADADATPKIIQNKLMGNWRSAAENCAQLAKRINALHTKQQSLSDEISDTKQAHTRLQQQHAQLDTETNAKQQLLTQVQKKLDALQETHNTLHASKAEIDKAHEVLSARFKDLQQQLTVVQQEKQELHKELQSVEERAQQAQRDYVQLTHAQQQLNQESKVLQAEKETLQTDVSALREAKVQSEEAYQALKVAKQGLAEKNQQLDEQLRQLTTELDESKEQFNSLALNQNALIQDKQKLSEEIEYITQEKIELQEDLQALKQEEAQWQIHETEFKQEKQEFIDKINAFLAEKNSLTHEVAQLRNFNDYLDERNQLLNAGIEQKHGLLADMLDTLKEPLDSAQILAKALANNVHKNLDQHEEKFARRLQVNLGVLRSFLTELSEMTDIAVSSEHMQIIPCIITDLMDKLRRQFVPLVETKGLRIALKADTEIPKVINIDAGLLQQLLSKLFVAALQMTQTGGISLNIKTVQQGWSQPNVQLDKAQNVIAFVLADTGRGMNAEQCEAALEPLKAGIMRIQDIGLGFAIAHKLALLLGGELKLSSIPHKGTVATLYLPLTERMTGAETQNTSSSAVEPA